MQLWPPQFEELLNSGEVELPTAELDVDLKTYAQLVCNILDIPSGENDLGRKSAGDTEGDSMRGRQELIHSLHVLFSLYSEMQSNAAISGGPGQPLPPGIMAAPSGPGQNMQNMGSAEVQTL